MSISTSSGGRKCGPQVDNLGNVMAFGEEELEVVVCNEKVIEDVQVFWEITI
jgi:hypothetical protein